MTTTTTRTTTAASASRGKLLVPCAREPGLFLVPFHTLFYAHRALPTDGDSLFFFFGGILACVAGMNRDGNWGDVPGDLQAQHARQLREERDWEAALGFAFIW